MNLFSNSEYLLKKAIINLLNNESISINPDGKNYKLR